MHSIRTKIILLTVMVIIVTMGAVSVLSTLTIRNVGTDSSEQILTLLCQSGERNLNAYFDSIEQSVKAVSAYADEDLSDLSADQFGTHVDRVKRIFAKTADSTAGILTYYYRIDPAFSKTEKGFWFVKSGDEFKEHEVTDITQYDTSDQSKLVWFSVPKATGRSIWLSPYFTENLGAYVFSYNTPIYQNNRFIGVIGIEIDYHTIVSNVKSISLFENGYAFINDDDGNIIYHPRIDISRMTGDNKPQTPEGLMSEKTIVKYTYEGVEKEAAWTHLHNGMRLNVTVPTSEINRNWQNMIMETILITIGLLIVFVFITWRLSRRIAQPLRKLTDVALQVDQGNYDVDLDYKGKDEVGILTNTFKQLTGHLKTYISDLNNLVYSDALTSVRNKGAFDVYVRQLQARIDKADPELEFAIGIFDCDRLKEINDKYGHQYGNIYLKSSVSVICQVFHQSPVFRVGGDEFAVILMNEDFRKREELACLFEKQCADLRNVSENDWDKVSVSLGIADYNPETDEYVGVVIERADTNMYKNKRNRKSMRK